MGKDRTVPDVAAIVPAAGSGRRLGGRVRKPFVRLAGVPILIHSLRALQASPDIRWIQPVVAPGDQRRVARLLARYRITKALPPCAGGRSRAESVANGFAALPSAVRWVLVHDAARPCTSRAVISRVLRQARRFGAAACGVPAGVTVKSADRQGRVTETLDRERLWLIQTPQAFRADWFAKALARHRRLDRFPDDAAVVEAAGYPVRLVPGEPLNVKITTPDDLLLAAVILRRRNGSP